MSNKSSSKCQLKQRLYHTSDKSTDSGYEYGEVTVYRAAPDKIIFEVSEDPKKKCAEIISMDPSNHDNILSVKTTDDVKYIWFDNSSDMEAWCSTIGTFMKSCERSRPRAQSVQTRPRNTTRDNGRMFHSSPATPDDMFSQRVHRDRPLKPVSQDDDAPIYENDNFDPEILAQRDAYLDKHMLKQIQEENYQPLEHVVGTDKEVDKYVEQDVYEEVSVISQPLPLMSREYQGPIKKALPLPNKKKVYGPREAASVSPHPGQQIKSVEKKEGKGRPPMTPPKHTKPKQLVRPQPHVEDDLYVNANPLDHDGQELEAKCDVGKDRVTSIFERDGSVSSIEVRISVQIPKQKYELGDISLGDKDGNIIVERTKLSKYLNTGDQLLQINGIDVRNTGKEFAEICLNRVNSDKINLEILRHFHQG